jgi:hypothetical protein
MAAAGQVEGEHPYHQILNGETADLRQYAALELPPAAKKPAKPKPKAPVVAGLFD